MLCSALSFVIESMWDVNESIGLLSVVQDWDSVQYLTEYLCDWESFASERNAVRWKQLEPGVLILSGCII